MIPATLQTRDLQVHVGTVRVCDAASLRFEPGSCWAILGVNGAGKTTLLHTLAGLRPPQAGEIRLDDRPLVELERRAIARRLGLMPQDTPDPFPATVLETALLGRHPWLSRWQWESADDEALARQALAELGLAPLADRLVTTLSGGERRRRARAPRAGRRMPRQALVVRGVDEGVFLLRDDVAHFTEIETGLAEADWIEVTAGLEPGDTVATMGANLLHDGDTVRVIGAKKSEETPS
jgi:ABC-type transport system involved in cytochrome c biogenesis ATPase subunit